MTKSKMSKIKIAAILLVLAAVIIAIAAVKNKNNTLNTIKAGRGDITQEVSATGKTKPVKSVDLSFEKTGAIKSVYVKIGDKVRRGDVLAALDSSVLYSTLSEYEANLEAQKAKLDELKNSPRPEDIKIKQKELEKAKQNLKNYYSDATNILYAAYEKANNAVYEKTDPLFTNPKQPDIQLAFSVNDSQIKTDVELQRINANAELDKFKKELDGLSASSTQDKLDKAIAGAEEHLNVIRKFLNKAIEALNHSTSLSQADLAAYKGNINSGITDVSTAISNVSSERQNIASQKITIEKIKYELDLELAGPTKEEIDAQEAAVKQAQAKIQNIKDQIAKTILRSPINGIITKQDAKEGEIAAANKNIISVISQDGFEVEANIPEIDIAKIKIGDRAYITLDAYGENTVFKATVSSIDPAETVIEGVSTYKTKFLFGDINKEIKPGMTANIDIITDKKKNVISIPQRAVFEEHNKTFVIAIGENNKPVKKEIKTGIRGINGEIEVIKGIKEGEEIVLNPSSIIGKI